MVFYHFSHHHSLVLRDMRGWGKDDCNACNLPISHFTYTCLGCDFFIHRSCAELPREMVHPFHPQHTLTLLTLSPYASGDPQCNACGMQFDGFTFHCSECPLERSSGFDLDIHCAASLRPTKVNHQMQRRRRIDDHDQHHPHPLIKCDHKKDCDDHDVLCSCCRLPIIKGRPIFVCLECNLLMDESCSRLPLDIKHPFHPIHPLTLGNWSKDSKLTGLQCNFCRMSLKYFHYHCSKHDFDLHIACASLMPNSNKKHVTGTHPHSLIPCYRTNNSYLPLFCTGCLQPFLENEEEDNSIYVCLDCRLLLHESCARLSHKIEHPFHPKHPLTLVDELIFNDTNTTKTICNVCGNKCDGFVYRCLDCKYHSHLKCALLVAPFLYSALIHQHPLALLDFKKANFLCITCQLPCKTPFLRCVECDFSIHLHCLSVLPSLVEHDFHLHSLTLTHSPIKDYEDEDDDSEFLCDACEKERLLHEPTYYCAECHYVAHVHCVISEVFPYLQREPPSLSDKLGKIKLTVSMNVVEDNAEAKLESDDAGTSLGGGTEDHDDQATAKPRANNYSKEFGNNVGDSVLDDLDAEIEKLQKQIDELKALTVKLDQLKERRAQYVLSLQNTELHKL